ncbi:DNA translocase FtsK [Caldalkalibacillus mannanilyticus]|uniref:DNA translocase FtsK n=1 Tax=Caldalkalibacillus mannanilyticus TaxID=1418 RepID=UPI000469261F|nr:DNA translocase FtsK [Caldalkalibacillus mannanilyticus]
MFNRIIGRIKNYFFDDQENIQENIIDQKQDTQKKQKKTVYSSVEIEGRVQNIYPKAGAYRFPIPFEAQQKMERLERGKREEKEYQQGSINGKEKIEGLEKSKRQEKIERREKAGYFQGNLRHSEVTPSPVFGFGQHRKKDESDVFESAIEEQSQQEDKGAEEIRNSVVQPLFDNEPELPSGTQQGPEEKTKPDSESVAPLIEEEKEPSKSFLRLVSEASQEDVIQPQPLQPSTRPQPIQQIPASREQVPLPIEKEERIGYQFPQLNSLLQAESQDHADDAWVDQQARILMETFDHFNLKAELMGVTQGPTVTRFEIQPAPGIKISKFTNLQDDLKLSLAAKEIRIEAPIPGKNAIGIEVPNLSPKPVHLGDILVSNTFQESASPLTICLGSDLSGEPVVTDIQKMPHGLIAGATGSGKSVCINSLLVSLLYKASPEQLRLLLIDPKVVELTPYQSIPHLITPVVTDPKRATAALKWAVEEMERRYQLFAYEGVRDLSRYNKVMEEKTGESWTLPYIVIIIDELADLMMVSPQDVEDAICRITQKARACGIHLIVATQRPSVDVITGLIKANIPTRLAFSVSSQVDSRTILDMAGAERLLGRGDMLFLQNGASKPIRVQGNFVSDDEIERIIEEVSAKDRQRFLFTSDELSSNLQDSEIEDELLEEVTFFVMEQGVASASSLQRKFRIGYNRAARLIDWMEEQGIVSESLGSKPRNVIWTQEQFLEWLDNHSVRS